MDHKKMDVWRESMNLVESIYQISSSFPDGEKYGLTSQIRRAAISVPSNIAEGAARSSDKEFARYIDIALGSLVELETQLIISIKLEFTLYSKSIDDKIIQVRKLLLGTRKYLNKSTFCGTNTGGKKLVMVFNAG